MQYNVAQLLKEPIGSTRSYPVHADIADLDPELPVIRPLTGEVRFLRTQSGVLVEGDLSTEVGLACSRCQEPLTARLELEIEEEYRPTIDVLTGRRLAMEEEDRALWIDAHHILDLTEVVRQGLFILLPMHPLCRPECKGLCPVCGQNWNEGPCDCAERESDPRWSLLKELL
ncbi:MAG: DUF177 domain-containing protein [Anaerolineae bacterium]|nr:DUF177 domain-containing protein [Anaerolineae bacterium]